MPKVSAFIAALLLLLGTAVTPVQAAAPSNDDIGNPTPISAIPFSEAPYSTADATTGSTDPDFCFGGPPDAHTVWYEYRATANGRLLADTAGSNYDTTLYVGTDNGSGGIDVLSCTDDTPTSRQAALVFDATAGTTYLFMVGDCCAGGGNGGMVTFSLQVGPPPLTLGLTVDPTVRVTKTGVATVTGTATCSETPQFGFLDIQLRESLGRFYINGFTEIELDCSPGGTPWSASLSGDNGKFAAGRGVVQGSAFACGTFECADASVEQAVRLRTR